MSHEYSQLDKHQHSYLVNQVPAAIREKILEMLRDIQDTFQDYGTDSLGVGVAKSQDRNLLFAFMTAAAVVELKEQGKQRITTIEPGVGLGINSFAALYAGATMAIGTDIDSDCIELAHSKAREYGLHHKTDFRLEDTLTGDYSGKQADVIIIEHIGPGLTSEPQFQMARKMQEVVLPYSIFVPSSVDCYLDHPSLNGGKYLYAGTINFNGHIDDVIEFQLNTTVDEDINCNSPFTHVRFALRDFRNETLIRADQAIHNLPMDTSLILDVPIKKGYYNLRLLIDTRNYNDDSPFDSYDLKFQSLE